MINVLRDLLNAGKSTDENSPAQPATPKRYSYVTINDIVKIYSDKINETALNEEIGSATIFVGGEFSIDYVDEKSYTCSYKLFFQDKNAETYEIKAGSKPLDIQRLKKEALQELTEQKNIKFDIPELTEEVRGTYKVVRK